MKTQAQSYLTGENLASSLGPQQLGTYLAMGRFIVQGGPLLVATGVK